MFVSHAALESGKQLYPEDQQLISAKLSQLKARVAGRCEQQSQQSAPAGSDPGDQEPFGRLGRQPKEYDERVSVASCAPLFFESSCPLRPHCVVTMATFLHALLQCSGCQVLQPVTLCDIVCRLCPCASRWEPFSMLLALSTTSGGQLIQCWQ